MKMDAEVWEKLSREEKEILIQTAMILPPVTIDIFFQTISSPPTVAFKALEKFNRLGIIKPCKSKGTGFYVFPDAREASHILDLASKAEINDNARALISCYDRMQEPGPDKWLQIAHFYSLSDIPPAHHFDQLIKAAEYCMEKNNLKDAFAYYYLVVSKFILMPESREEKHIYVKAAVGLCANSEDILPLSTQERFITQALCYLEDENDLNLHVQAMIFKARCMLRQGDFAGADEFHSKGLALASTSEDPVLKEWISVYQSDIQIFHGQIQKAIYQYEKLVGKLEAFPSNALFLKAYSRLGWSYGISGDIYRGLGIVNVVKKKAIDLDIQYIQIYSELMKLMILTDSRRIEEARTSLNIILRYPESELDHYVLWAAYGKKAYFAYLDGNIDGAYAAYQISIMHSKTLGCPHFHGTDHLEYLYAIEKAGLEKEIFQKKLEGFLTWPDIYTKGAALRYRAMYAITENNPTVDIPADLEQSLQLLETAGANIELAQAQILTARFLLIQKTHTSQIGKLLKSAWDILSNVNAELFPDELKKYVEEDNSETLLVDTIVEVGNTLSQTRDRFLLLSKIIKVIIRLVGAERGGIFLLDHEGKIRLESSRNLEPETITKNSFTLSFELISRVVRTGKESIFFEKYASLIITGQISENGWVICYPIRLGNKILGALYVDNSFSTMRLPKHKLPLLKAIGNQIAAALDNVDAYEKITRLRNRLEAETRFYRKENQKPVQTGHIIGKSPAIRKVLETINQVASSDATVLISGETGVGKELAAKAIHSLSHRSKGPFIPINIATIAPDLIYSELFGHRKGAFTGAIDHHIGRFELADGGTFFMDDVDNLSLSTQIRLLRVLEEREFQKVGDTRTIKSDFRLIAATNQDLNVLVANGKFRSDFYYRLNVVPLTIPPLRKRKEDIPLLASHFLNTFSRKISKPIRDISSTNMERLMNYSWPGNIRELSHYIERAVILTRGTHLKLPRHDHVSSGQAFENRFLGLNEMLEKHIIEALNQCNWKVNGRDGAAALLKMKPQTLYSKIRKMGITKNKTIQ
jgi:transcriptional regulator with GAF, ATPase, and Fis domain/tetratricopeptide (TPR) repeat protein